MFARIGKVAALGLGLVLGGIPALAEEDRPVVVELFTSQGCSSCPPADAFLSVLAPRDDVIALGFHVDYWDYIGWKDVFASRHFSERQKAYAKAAGRRSVYTPQMIISGTKDVIGNHPMDVTELIDEHRDRPTRIDLDLTRGPGGVITLDAEALTPFPHPLLIQLIRYLPEAKVEITRGENAGHKLVYSNIVTDWSILAEWDARQPFKADVPIKGDAPVVVLVQQKGPGAIEAAARLR